MAIAMDCLRPENNITNVGILINKTIVKNGNLDSLTYKAAIGNTVNNATTAKKK